MTKLSDICKVSEFKIPNSDMVIKLRHYLPWFDFMQMMNIKDESERGKVMIWKTIESWNLTDDNGNILPIDLKTISELPGEIIIPVTQELDKIAQERDVKKKN